jgi:ABC-2 type transport system permease protein
MRKYLLLFKAFFIYSLQGKLEYRFDFFINILRSVGWLFVGVFSFQVLYAQTAVIGGWTKAEAMSLFGIFVIITQLWYIFLAPNLLGFSDMVRTGEFDFLLMKPISTQFIVSLKEVYIYSFSNFLLGVGIVFYYGAQVAKTVNLFTIAISVLLIGNGLIILYSIMLALVTLSFWIINFSSFWHVYEVLTEGARYPVTFFKNPLRFLFTFIIPLSVIFTIPAEFLVKETSWWVIIVAFLVGVLCFYLSSKFFYFGVRHYNSASS